MIYICIMKLKCPAEWLATVSVTGVQSKGIKMGLEGRGRLWNMALWEVSFFMSLLGDHAKKNFWEVAKQFCRIHILFVRDCAMNVCTDGFVHSGLCLRCQIEAQLTKSHISHLQLIDHWLLHVALIYDTAQGMTA